MAQSWVCPAGHRGNERLPLPTCPVCCLPVDFVTEKAAPPIDETLAGNSGARPAPQPVQDLVFLTAQGSSRPRDEPPIEHTLEMPSKPSAPPPFIPQNRTPAPPTSSADRPSVLSWVPPSGPLSEVSQDDTMQRPGDSAPPSAGSHGFSSQGGATEVEGAESGDAPGATLVRPSAKPTATGHGGDAACAVMMSGYEILGVLGRGGMGVVYKARQLGLNRVVALKMILHGSHATTEDMLRFKIEAESVAKLRHPNIVQIFDVGERDGKPFFSLEYLEGGSLQGRLKGEPLPSKSAAALLETLARAVDHAHRHGIVHRDLKPANVLIAEPAPTPLEKCTPKITDFGLAKRLEAEDQGQTNTEAILGTPTYMAPEQASNSKTVGPAADLYALGAILYDLLTGRPPFKGTTVLDTLQMVQKAEPVAPVALNNKIPRDLQTICLKCLEKEPGRRYKSAEALADDLRAFLDGRPIQARPVGTVERTWKWAKRNPTLAALVTLSILAPLVIAAVTTAAFVKVGAKNLELNRTNEDLDKERKALAKTNDELDQKKKTLEKTNTALERSLVEEKKALAKAEREEKEAQNAFMQAQTAVGELIQLSQRLLRNEPGMEKRRKALVAAAVRTVKPFVEKPTANPASRVRAARAYRVLGDLQGRMGDYDEADKSFLAALALYEKLIEEKAQVKDADLQSEVVETELQRWNLLEGRDPGKAERALDAMLSRIEGLPAGLAGKDVHRRNRAVLLANRAIHNQKLAVNDAKAFEKAEQDYAVAASELMQLTTLPEVPLELARLDVNRSALYLVGSPGQTGQAREQELDKAASAGVRAVLALRKILKSNPQDADAAVELGRAYANLGLIYQARKQELEKAAAAGGRAVVSLLKILKTNPQDADAANELTRAQANLGLIYQAKQKAQESATENYNDAVKLFERLSTDYPLYVDFKHLLAVALSNQGMFLTNEARELQEQYERGRKPLTSEQSSEVQERYKLAGKPLQRGRELLENLTSGFTDVPVYGQDLARLCTNQGVLFLAAGQPAAAEEPLKAAAELLEAALKQPSANDALKRDLTAVEQNLMACHTKLVREAEKRSDWETAEPHVKALADLREKRVKALPLLPASAAVRQRLARAGEALLARADYVGTLRSLARVQEHRGDHQGAAQTVGRLRPYLPANNPAWIEAAVLLCRCIRMAEEDEALSDTARAKVIDEYGKMALVLLDGVAGRSSELAEALKGGDFAPLKKLPAFSDDYRKLVAKAGKKS